MVLKKTGTPPNTRLVLCSVCGAVYCVWCCCLLAAVNNPFLPKLAAGFFPEDMASCIRRALALSVASRRAYGKQARLQYLQEQAMFVASLRALKQEADAHVLAYKTQQQAHKAQ